MRRMPYRPWTDGAVVSWQADPTKVGHRAKKRGLPQLGTLGAGNHYAEIQVRQSPPACLPRGSP